MVDYIKMTEQASELLKAPQPVVVLILNALFAALCIALGIKEYNKSDAAEQEPAATATP